MFAQPKHVKQFEVRSERVRPRFIDTQIAIRYAVMDKTVNRCFLVTSFPPPLPSRTTAKAIATSWPVFAGITLLMVGNGLQGTLLGIRATLEDFGALVTGAVMACYYAGFITSSFAAPLLIQRVGHVRSYAAFSAAASVAILAHGLVVEPIVWALMRGITGFCLAGIYIVSESWLNSRSENEVRGSVMSAYTMLLLVSVAAGQLVVSAGNPTSPWLFIIGSMLISLAVLPMVMSIQPSPEVDTPEQFGIRELATASPLGAALALGAGLIYGAYSGMGAAFATHAGLSTTWAAYFMVGITLAGGLAQWPLGKLSDMLPRRWVVLGSTAAAAAMALIAMRMTANEPVWLVATAALFGAAALPLYSLANAVANDRVPPQKRVAAGSGLILLYGCGSVAGPILSAGAIELLGDRGYFLCLALICGGLAAWTVFRMVISWRAATQPTENTLDRSG